MNTTEPLQLPSERTALRNLALALASVMSLAALNAQVIQPPFAADYSFTDLGNAPSLPSPAGGLTFKRGNPNRILIGGAANSASAKIYEIGVVRDGGGHITGFSGVAVEVASAAGGGGAGIDGGLAYGPDGVLFYTSYPDNRIEQLKPGSILSDKSINATPIGIAGSVGSLLFVPPGFPGAGRLKILSYLGTAWYDSEVTPDGTGTFDIVNVGAAIPITAANGPEGAIYVGAGNAGFANSSVLVASYGLGKIVAYEVNANGDPITTTARDFMTGLGGAEGAVVDPLTNDFLFSTFGGGDRVIVVRGFEPPPPATEPVLTTIWTGAKVGGDPVPGAGIDPRIVPDSRFVKFGVPALNDQGERAFLASWTAPTGKGTGIFAGNIESLVVAVGDPAPDTSGLFASFRDPMFNHAGRVAFIGKANGAGVTPADDTGIWTNAFSPGGGIVLKAREGGAAPGVTDAVFKSFKSVALSDTGLGFTAFLAEGPGGVTKDDDLGLWIDASFGPVLVAREAQVLPEGTVKKFLALLPGALTRGHGNGVGDRGDDVILGFDEELGAIVTPMFEPVVAVRVQFVDGSQALYQATVAGLELVTKSGDHAEGYDPGVNYSKFGIPGPATNAFFAFLAKAKGPGVTGANGTGVNVWDNSSIHHLLKNGDSVEDLSGVTFKSFKDPVANSSREAAVPAKVTGSGIDKDNDEGIWWLFPFGGQELVAREGDDAPGTGNSETEEHALFSKFKSIALPEFGAPVFVAKLRTGASGTPGPGGTTKANDDGAWSYNPLGYPQLIIREGQEYDGKTVKKIAFLASVPASSTQARAHNDNGHLLMRLDFTDKSQAIVAVDLPEPQFPE